MAQGALNPLNLIPCMRTSPTLLDLEEHKLLDIKEIYLGPKLTSLTCCFHIKKVAKILSLILSISQS